MNIDHIAIWTTDIERLKSFYETYFDAKSGKKYLNETKRFQSYFLTFNSGARLEIMQKPEIPDRENKSIQFSGYAHIAISVGSKKNVDDLTQKLIDDGYKNPDGPRHTGDGYYESVILDPHGNRIEITE